MDSCTILFFRLGVDNYTFKTECGRRIGSVGNNLHGPVLPVVFFFCIESQKNHSLFSVLYGIMGKIRDGTSAGNFNVGDEQRSHAGIFKIILDLNYFPLPHKSKIVLGIFELNVGAVILRLRIQCREKKYPVHK